MEIEFKNVTYKYSPNTPFENLGLDDISFLIKSGSFTTIIGHTGSGKSTLLQHLNALIKPTDGEIKIADYVINRDTNNKNLKPLRKHVGMVFQFPESQLFEESVERDIMFGPMNFGVSEEDAKVLAKDWVNKVGLDESILDKSPFDLSGGQMRRVAIAGVMASEPDILVLDEPAAGLDPAGRIEMMKIFTDYQKAGHTIILVTHNMNDVAEYADDVLVLEKGKLIKHDSPKEVFSDQAWLLEHHLNEPEPTLFANELRDKGFIFNNNPLNIEQLADEISKNLN